MAVSKPFLTGVAFLVTGVLLLLMHETFIVKQVRQMSPELYGPVHGMRFIIDSLCVVQALIGIGIMLVFKR